MYSLGKGSMLDTPLYLEGSIIVSLCLKIGVTLSILYGVGGEVVATS